jgi:ADP-heptose:LPS heptosyltransferase
VRTLLPHGTVRLEAGGGWRFEAGGWRPAGTAGVPVLDPAARALPRRDGPGPRVLMIRLRLIGDVVFTTPAIRAVRRVHPTARLCYLVEPPAAPVVARNPHLDEVIVAERRRGVRRLADDLALAARLRRERFDVVLDFHGGPRASALALATRAPVRVGYRVKGRSWVYTHVVERPADLRPRHSVENQWDLLRGWLPGLGPPDPTRDRTEMPEDKEVAGAMAGRLRVAGVTPDHALVVLHVSAGNPFRRWPLAHFVELVRALGQGGPTRRIILTSGPSEAEAAERVAAAAMAGLGPLADTVVRLGELSLPELRALVGRASLFIGGDSGPLHVASTTTTPIVGILGPTLAERSAPWRPRQYATEMIDGGPLPCRPCEQRRCAPGDFRCLAGITPEAVAAAAERALARAVPDRQTEASV